VSKGQAGPRHGSYRTLPAYALPSIVSGRGRAARGRSGCPAEGSASHNPLQNQCPDPWPSHQLLAPVRPIRSSNRPYANPDASPYMLYIDTDTLPPLPYLCYNYSAMCGRYNFSLIDKFFVRCSIAPSPTRSFGWNPSTTSRRGCGCRW
jgi:hypothetical protein